jgi:hypothetical protein
MIEMEVNQTAIPLPRSSSRPPRLCYLGPSFGTVGIHVGKKRYGGLPLATGPFRVSHWRNDHADTIGRKREAGY